MILVLVNKINIGDEDTSSGKKADGFTLESLSKLSEVGSLFWIFFVRVWVKPLIAHNIFLSLFIADKGI